MRRLVICVAMLVALGCKKEEVSSEPLDTMSTDTMADTMGTGATMTSATPVSETGTFGTSGTSSPPPSPIAPRPSDAMLPPVAMRPPPATTTGPAIVEVKLRDYAKIPVYYATTRMVADHDDRNVYGSDRGSTQYGVSWVSIPRAHEAGELEEPSVFTLTFREDPAKHVVLMEVKAMPKNRWYENLNASIAAGRAAQAFVFIHGYNVAFADAARRTAQIKYDLGFAGPAILFSWPSHGRESLYLADEANAEWSAPRFADFLVELRRRTGATTIHLIAHSLGNRVLSRALERIDLDPTITPKPKFSQIVLAAPDMDAEVFREQLAPRMRRLARGITLYGSSDDRAILASREAHQIARAGEGGDGLPVIDGIDSIDVTGIDASFLGHSYIGGVSVLGDVAQILCEGKGIATRFGIAKSRPAWKLVKSQKRRPVQPCHAAS
jgi:esterase/lipase superfamily enzyme